MKDRRRVWFVRFELVVVIVIGLAAAQRELAINHIGPELLLSYAWGVLTANPLIALALTLAFAYFVFILAGLVNLLEVGQ